MVIWGAGLLSGAYHYLLHFKWRITYTFLLIFVCHFPCQRGSFRNRQRNATSTHLHSLAVLCKAPKQHTHKYNIACFTFHLEIQTDKTSVLHNMFLGIYILVWISDWKTSTRNVTTEFWDKMHSIIYNVSDTSYFPGMHFQWNAVV